MVMVVRETSFHGGPRLEDGGTVVVGGVQLSENWGCRSGFWWSTLEGVCK